MVANSPGLIAGSNVLHRLLVPRHPPIALSSLSHNKNYKDARVHYTVLKIRAGTPATTTTYIEQHPHQGKPTRPRCHHQRFGEDWPQPHTYTNPEIRKDPAVDVVVTQKNRSSSPKGSRPDSSGPNSAPRPFTTRFRPFHARLPKERLQYLVDLCRSRPNGQCSTFRSIIALERMSRKRRVDTRLFTRPGVNAP